MGAGGLPRGDPGCRIAAAWKVLLLFLSGDEAPGDPHTVSPAPGSVRQGHRHGEQRHAQPHQRQGAGAQLVMAGVRGGR